MTTLDRLDRRPTAGEVIHACAELAPSRAARLELLASRRDFTLQMLVREAAKRLLARVESEQS